jgi:hypothetical protein
MSTGTSLYDKDSHAWTIEQAALLRGGKWHALDVANLIEEIESLGTSQRKEVRSRLRRLVMHLLKWRYQPTRRTPSWRRTIRTQRLEIDDALSDSPSLRPQVPALLQRAYPGACTLAADETGLPLATFPEACPWTVEQVLDEDFWPEETR